MLVSEEQPVIVFKKYTPISLVCIRKSRTPLKYVCTRGSRVRAPLKVKSDIDLRRAGPGASRVYFQANSKGECSGFHESKHRLLCEVLSFSCPPPQPPAALCNLLRFCHPKQIRVCIFMGYTS